MWLELTKSCDKSFHKYSPHSFAHVYEAYLSDISRSPFEFREKLSLRIPVFLWRMSPNDITNTFVRTIKSKLLTSHLFDNHYHVLFWRRNHWFGPENYPIIIRSLIDIKHHVEIIYLFI